MLVMCKQYQIRLYICIELMSGFINKTITISPFYMEKHNKRNFLVLVDCQYDFCNPQGSLYVTGATDDMKRLSNLIIEKANCFSKIFVGLDYHPIGHCSFHTSWKDKQGAIPAPYSHISTFDYGHIVYKPIVGSVTDEAFVDNEFDIWPEHCVAHSIGATLDSAISNALSHYLLKSEKSGFVEYYTKGESMMTEEYGNIELARAVSSHAHNDMAIYVAGEALDFCVFNTLKQIRQHTNLPLYLIEDCTSCVIPKSKKAIYDELEKLGVQFIASTNI